MYRLIKLISFIVCFCMLVLGSFCSFHFKFMRNKNISDVKNQIIMHIDDVLDYCRFACYSFCRKFLNIWTILLRRAKEIC